MRIRRRVEKSEANCASLIVAQAFQIRSPGFYPRYHMGSMRNTRPAKAVKELFAAENSEGYTTPYKNQAAPLKKGRLLVRCFLGEFAGVSYVYTVIQENNTATQKRTIPIIKNDVRIIFLVLSLGSMIFLGFFLWQ